MIEIKGKIHKILLPKKTKNDYYVLPIVLSFNYKGSEQMRYMQAVSKFVQQQISDLNEGDLVKVKLAIKGKYNETQEKYFNLDEIESITALFK
jgi:hypothetical protein